MPFTPGSTSTNTPKVVVLTTLQSLQRRQRQQYVSFAICAETHVYSAAVLARRDHGEAAQDPANQALHLTPPSAECPSLLTRSSQHMADCHEC